MPLSSDLLNSNHTSNVIAIPKLIGSSYQAWVIDTLTWSSSYSVMVIVSPVVSEMIYLNTSLSFVLIAMPSVLFFLLQIPVGYLIDTTGGITCIIRLRYLSSIASIGFVILSASVDLTDIDSADWRYMLLCLLGVLAGSGGASNQLISNINYWSTQEKSASNRATYGGIAGLAPGISLLLLQFINSGLGLFWTFVFFCILSLISTLLARRYLVAPYYHQLLAQGYSKEVSKIIAQRKGQALFPCEQTEGFFKTLQHSFLDRRCAVLIVCCYSSFGGAIFLSTGLYQILIKAANMSVLSATGITAMASILSTFIRSLSGKFIMHFDYCSQGAYTFFLFSLSTLIGSLILAIPRPFPGLIFIIFATVLMSIGLGMGNGAVFNTLYTWSKPKNTMLRQYEIGAMTGIVGSFGGSSTLIFSLAISLLTSLQGIEGYSNSFLMIALLSFISSILMLLMHHNVCYQNSYFFAPWKKCVNENGGHESVTVIEESIIGNTLLNFSII